METPFRIGICGIDELGIHAAAPVTHVLSILDPGWPAPAALAGFGPHKKLELRFDDVTEPRPGTVPPAPSDIERMLAFGRDFGPDTHLLVHCHAGVSRSAAALALLLAQAMPATPGAEIFAHILKRRPQIWPNLRMIEFGDAMLGRAGDLIAAARGVYRQRLGRHPPMAADFRAGGRGREVDFAMAETQP